MPYRTDWTPAEKFMEWAGRTEIVEVFHVYKSDDVEQGARTYWFATNDDGSDESGHGSDGVFDVRDLAAWRETGTKDETSDDAERIRNTIIRAIETGELTKEGVQVLTK